MNEQERLEWIANRWEEALSNLASEDYNQDYEDLKRNYADLLQHYEQLRAAQEESEHQMHMRIRSGYDKTIADSWRAHAAKIEAERDEAKAERDKAQAALIDSALIQAKLLEERDEARATLAFLQAEYCNSADETLTRDALELKVKLLEHQLTSIKTAFHELRVLRSSCEDSNAGSLRVHLVEAEFDKLHSLLR